MTNSSPDTRLAETIRSYDAKASEYALTTPVLPSDGLKAWLDASVSSLPKIARILELGSGTGRDALYLESLGYEVVCSDITPQFIQILKTQNHKHVFTIDALKDGYPLAQDLIFADALVVHFEKEQMLEFLKRTYKTLNHKGRLAITTKFAQEYKVEAQNRLGSIRWFVSWPSHELIDLATSVGYKVVHETTSPGVNSKSEWLNLILEKI